MLQTIALIVLLPLLGAILLALRRARREIERMKGDVEIVDNHNRMLQEQRDALKVTLGETTGELDATKKRVEAVEAEKREADRQRAASEESAVRAEKARAELEEKLATLNREHESLENRVLDFQGQWSRQLSTLEAEISTLIRQLAEFRKGANLPIPTDGSQPEPEIPPLDREATWTLSAPVPAAPTAKSLRGAASLTAETAPRLGAK